MKINFNDIWRDGDKYNYIYHTKRGFLFFKKPIHIKFIAKYPHYNLGDIIWMLENSRQKDEFLNDIQSCGGNWSEKIDIKIGTLEVKIGNNADLSSDALNFASDKASELRIEWSEETGIKYPDLEMPKRPLL